VGVQAVDLRGSQHQSNIPQLGRKGGGWGGKDKGGVRGGGWGERRRVGWEEEGGERGGVASQQTRHNTTTVTIRCNITIR
jgi:hypothetical protein